MPATGCLDARLGLLSGRSSPEEWHRRRSRERWLSTHTSCAQTAAAGAGLRDDTASHQLDHAGLADHAVNLLVLVVCSALQPPAVLHHPLNLVLWPRTIILHSIKPTGAAVCGLPGPPRRARPISACWRAPGGERGSSLARALQPAGGWGVEEGADLTPVFGNLGRLGGADVGRQDDDGLRPLQAVCWAVLDDLHKHQSWQVVLRAQRPWWPGCGEGGHRGCGQPEMQCRVRAPGVAWQRGCERRSSTDGPGVVQTSGATAPRGVSAANARDSAVLEMTRNGFFPESRTGSPQLPRSPRKQEGKWATQDNRNLQPCNTLQRCGYPQCPWYRWVSRT